MTIRWLEIAMELKDNPSNDDVIKKIIEESKPSIVDEVVVVDDIYVMSYNLNWESMLPMAHSNLRQQCKNKDINGVNRCLYNMSQIIKGNGNSWNSPKYTHPETFDFIATQESTLYFGELQNLIGDKYDVVSTYITRRNKTQIHIVTFYDKTKYKNIFHMGFGTKGRPKHIILFENNKTKALYLFINLHNEHKHGPDLQKEINDAINGINDPAFTNKKSDIKNIIVAGDFNDEGRKYFNGLYVLDKKVRYNNTLPETCCYDPTTGTGQISKIGDYVLSTMNITEMYVPLSTKWRNPSKYPASDHLPVVAVIKQL